MPATGGGVGVAGGVIVLVSLRLSINIAAVGKSDGDFCTSASSDVAEVLCNAEASPDGRGCSSGSAAWLCLWTDISCKHEEDRESGGDRGSEILALL